MQDEEIIGFDALYASMNLCAKNVRRKANVGRFLMYGMDEILKLQVSPSSRRAWIEIC